MTRNMGTLDRVVRAVLGAALLSLLFLLDGALRFAGLLGVVLLVTAVASYCPIYALLGVRTCPLRRVGAR
ncbi:MAG: DUF2892 domain-containing protein [SAR202 cluster bacterium]|nr:DUF2892 domain-containing protein [SAR202 cluster bacterium]